MVSGESSFIELLRGEIAETLGWAPSAWIRIARGYTPAARYRVRDGERRAYVKIATTPGTVAHMHREIRTYSRLSGRFMPRCLGWSASGDHPFIALEDLGDAVWPPPWSEAQVNTVLDQIAELHAVDAPLLSYAEVHGRQTFGWEEVARNPKPFAAVGVASEHWLARNIDALVSAEADCSPEGSAVTHWDIRSDNLCISNGSAVFVDWGEACLSNPKLDLAFWLPSLAYESGIAPERILPDEPAVAAWVAGYFAARAGLSELPDAPSVRQVQKAQLSTALPWACRAVGLEVPAAS